MANQDLPVLVAETNDVRPFARLLRGIGLRHDAVMEISEAGFAVTVEEVRTLCAIAWIPTSLFTSFTYNQPSIPATFEFNLDSLLLCLNIFGNAGPTSSNTTTSAVKSKRRWAGEGEVGVDEENEEYQVNGRKGKERRTGMRMEWRGRGHDLNVLLSDDSRGPTTTCELRTLEPEELMNAQFDPEDMALYVIMKSEWLRDALFDLPPSCTRITLLAHPPKEPIPPREPNATFSSIGRRERRAEVGQFTILAEGDFGMTELDYPNDKEVMDKFDCAEKVKFSYNSSHFALLHRALHQSLKVCLQIEKSGFLCVQIMMPLSENVEIGGHSGILEFKMHALEEDD